MVAPACRKNRQARCSGRAGSFIVHLQGRQKKLYPALVGNLSGLVEGVFNCLYFAVCVLQEALDMHVDAFCPGLLLHFLNKLEHLVISGSFTEFQERSKIAVESHSLRGRLDAVVVENRHGLGCIRVE